MVDYDDQTLNLNNNILTISKSNSTVDLSAYINQSNLWTENGANVYRSSGNVGLNTDDPTQKLDVNGKIRMRTGAINGHIPVSDANGVMTWTNPSSVFNDTNTNYYLNSANICLLYTSDAADE